jgi:hypothetical protein
VLVAKHGKYYRYLKDDEDATVRAVANNYEKGVYNEQ